MPLNGMKTFARALTLATLIVYTRSAAVQRQFSHTSRYIAPVRLDALRVLGAFENMGMSTLARQGQFTCPAGTTLCEYCPLLQPLCCSPGNDCVQGAGCIPPGYDVCTQACANALFACSGTCCSETECCEPSTLVPGDGTASVEDGGGNTGGTTGASGDPSVTPSSSGEAGLKPPAYTTKPPASTTKPPAYTTKPSAYTTKPSAYTTKPPAYTTKPPGYTAPPTGYTTAYGGGGACKTPYQPGELCAGAPGKPYVPWCGCADSYGTRYECIGPAGYEGYGTTCAKAREGMVYQVGERCLGAPNKPYVPYYPCVEGSSCTDQDEEYGLKCSHIYGSVPNSYPTAVQEYTTAPPKYTTAPPNYTTAPPPK
jgi:hypothetical protein